MGGRLERFGSGRFRYTMKNCEEALLHVGMCAMCEGEKQMCVICVRWVSSET